MIRRLARRLWRWLTGRRRKSIRTAWSCGVVPGHEHATEAEARECIRRHGRTAEELRREWLEAWQREGEDDE